MTHSIIIPRLFRSGSFAHVGMSNSAVRTLRHSFFSTSSARKSPAFSFPVHRFEPHPTLEHPLHGSISDAPQPVIVVIQEWWGINDQIKNHAQRISNGTGAITLVPDLYHGKMTLEEAEASHMMNTLNWPGALDELEVLVRSQQTADGFTERRKVGSVGFCMGGAMSLALAARMAKVGSPLNAVVSFYGIPSKQLIDVSEIPAVTPVQAHFGELDDRKGFSDPESAKALADRWGMTVKKLGGTHARGFHSLESNVYIHHGVGHAFMNDMPVRKGQGQITMSTERKTEFDAAWSRVFAFFIEHLKSV